METKRPLVVIVGYWFQYIWLGAVTARRIYLNARVTMKIRLAALAGVAALALSTPAMAADGWYVGLGGGWDNQDNINAHSTSGTTIPGKLSSSGSGIIAGAFGYSFGDGLRVEMEDAYTSHSFSGANGGSNSITSVMLNAVYDIPLDDKWKLSLGAGIGGGKDWIHATGTVASSLVNGTGDIARGTKTALEWQAIAGLAYSLNPDLDLFADFRYRSNEVNQNYPTFFTA